MPQPAPSPGRTLYRKIWNAHVIEQLAEDAWLILVDRQLIYEGSSQPAFDHLRATGRVVRAPAATLAMADHTVPTAAAARARFAGAERQRVDTLQTECAARAIPYFDLPDPRHGIVHVAGPEQGFAQPGMVVVCPDSHTSTHGAFGALAFGIGTSELEHVLATQTLIQRPARTLRVTLSGQPHPIVAAKDLALATIAALGAAGGIGHAVEFAGAAVRALSMAGRMTLCNMAVEAGCRSGLIAPDDTTIAWLHGRPRSPAGTLWQAAVTAWAALQSDPDATFDSDVTLDVTALAPQITWGTSPDETIPVTGQVPNPSDAPTSTQAAAWARAAAYMGVSPGALIADVPIDQIFIGSCTNSRLDDLRAAAAILRGRRLAPGVHGMVVPGSGLVKHAAEAEGLDRIFTEAGLEWRAPGCSMCFGNRYDSVAPGARCVSTTNRNFEGRQGPGARTHLVSPATAAASAIAGRIADPRNYC